MLKGNTALFHNSEHVFFSKCLGHGSGIVLLSKSWQGVPAAYNAVRSWAIYRTPQEDVYAP